MKTLYRLTVITLLLIIVVFSCQKKSKRSFDDLLKRHIIPVEQSVGMYNEFQKTRTDLLEPILKDFYKDNSFVDSKFVWFSLEDIKEYLAYIEAIQEENPNQKVSGLRVYFAVYPNSQQFNGKQVKNPKQQTFFMIPTVSTGTVDRKYNNLNHLPFVIKSNSNKHPLKGKFEIVKDLMLDYNKKQRIETYDRSFNVQKGDFDLSNTLFQRESNTIITSTIFNEGEMSPPPNGKE